MSNEDAYMPVQIHGIGPPGGGPFVHFRQWTFIQISVTQSVNRERGLRQGTEWLIKMFPVKR
jgi:hypothetical protein